MLPSGYLYYYYRREEALGNITRSEKTRGETILEINRAMSAELEGLESDIDASIAVYLKYYAMRENGYMAVESGAAREEAAEPRLDLSPEAEDDGGYAGVALDFVESLVSGRPREMVLSVPNRGSIDGLEDEDIVEVTCRIDAEGAHPAKIGRVPEPQMCLIRQVKLYERLAVEAIRERSLTKAAQALMIHPLVNSWSLGTKLARAYAKAHGEYAGAWA
jgi:6-phospho-beta-glucosidase